jgi:proteasome lid subunit RPN8/RPN11
MAVMTVYRTKPLPAGKNRGRLIVPAVVAESTRRALQQFHGADGRHEGLLYWGGRRADQDVLVVSALIPFCQHGRQRVMAPPAEIGRISKLARSTGLALVAQVHSHPGGDTRHSDGDDDLVLMPHEGMYSLVIGGCGNGSCLPREGAGLHQYQDGRWVYIPAEYQDALIIVPALVGEVR